MTLEDYRQQMDQADEALVRAFCQRMETAASIAAYKKEHGLPVLAKCPIDPQLAALSDAGMIETYGGEYLEGAADACEKLLKK